MSQEYPTTAAPYTLCTLYSAFNIAILPGVTYGSGQFPFMAIDFFKKLFYNIREEKKEGDSMMYELQCLIEDLVDHEVEVEFDYDFKYDTDDGGTVYYALNEDFNSDCNVDWKEFLLMRFGFHLTEENWFVMSILHELGHHYTIDYFTDEEWNKMCDELNSDDRKAVNFDHFNKQNELVATEWAIAYFNANPKEMEYFCSRINAEIKEIKCANT